jgi:5'-phosphate synthase pdxT subunit
MLRGLGVEVVEVRIPADLDGISALILPGGESTALISLLARWDLVEPLRALAGRGLPIWGTCAGAILLSSEVGERDHSIEQPSLGLARVRAVRNAFGRQVHSFRQDLEVAGLDSPFPGVFIRAPLLQPLSPEVEILCEVEEGPVLLRDRNLWLSSFHPELTSDSRIHLLFLRDAENGPGR